MAFGFPRCFLSLNLKPSFRGEVQVRGRRRAKRASTVNEPLRTFFSRVFLSRKGKRNRAHDGRVDKSISLSREGPEDAPLSFVARLVVCRRPRKKRDFRRRRGKTERECIFCGLMHVDCSPVPLFFGLNDVYNLRQQ